MTPAARSIGTLLFALCGDAPVLAAATPADSSAESLRTALSREGVSFELTASNYFQGLLDGDGDATFAGAGRLDASLNLDTERLGWWNGGLIRTHTEYRYGELRHTLGGAVLPTNLGARLPPEKDEVVITSLHLSQRIGERANLLVGKINALDLLASEPFFGGAGYLRFQHLAFAAPPSGVQPAVFFGGLLSLRTAPLAWTVMMFDPNDRSGDYLPDDLFHDGVNVAVTAAHGMKLAGRVSSFAITGIYSTRNGANLDELLLPAELRTGDKTGSWHVGMQFSHVLRESPHAAAGWGVFLKAGVSDGNPNPYQTFITGGVAGTGLWRSRPADRFGVGYFYYDLSDSLQSTLDPRVELHDEQGVEVYYTFVVAAWLNLTLDLQFIDPALRRADDAVIGGLRAQLRF